MYVCKLSRWNIFIETEKCQFNVVSFGKLYIHFVYICLIKMCIYGFQKYICKFMIFHNISMLKPKVLCDW